jgi:hypothetical protein
MPTSLMAHVGKMVVGCPVMAGGRGMAFLKVLEQQGLDPRLGPVQSGLPPNSPHEPRPYILGSLSAPPPPRESWKSPGGPPRVGPRPVIPSCSLGPKPVSFHLWMRPRGTRPRPRRSRVRVHGSKVTGVQKRTRCGSTEAAPASIGQHQSQRTLRCRRTEARNATGDSDCRLDFFPADSSMRWGCGIIKW